MAESEDDLRASLIAQFQAFMAERGKRMTRERAFVVEVVLKMASPFDAAAVLAAVGQTKGQLNVHDRRCIGRSSY